MYGSAQTKPLPTNEFKWLSQSEIDALEVRDCDEEDEHGYILEVDLLYPTKLHASHNSFPLAPERMVVTEEMMSDYSKGKKKIRM